MEHIDPSTIQTIIAQFGVPGAIFVLGWRALSLVKPYIKPICDAVLAAIFDHRTLVNTLQQRAEDDTNTLKLIHSTQTEHGQKIHEIHKSVVPYKPEARSS